MAEAEAKNDALKKAAEEASIRHTALDQDLEALRLRCAAAERDALEARQSLTVAASHASWREKAAEASGITRGSQIYRELKSPSPHRTSPSPSPTPPPGGVPPSTSAEPELPSLKKDQAEAPRQFLRVSRGPRGEASPAAGPRTEPRALHPGTSGAAGTPGTSAGVAEMRRSELDTDRREASSRGQTRTQTQTKTLTPIPTPNANPNP